MNKYFFILLSSLLFISIASAETIRIMPLGDSITEDWAFSDSTSRRPDSLRSGYRNYLWYALKAAKYDVDFVGSHKLGSAIRPIFDIDNEGWAGLKSTEVVDPGRHPGGFYDRLIWYRPHIILLHLGTNDWSSSVGGIRSILNEIDNFEENYQFHVKVIVAKIINSREPNSIFSSFNKNLESLVRQRSADGDDVVLVDMEHGAGIYYDSRDFQDRIHPNNSGYRKMANVWFNALDKILKHDNYAFLVPVYHMLLN